MEGRFEWHITYDKRHRKEVQRAADEFGFVFSEITGCPILGQGTYCYVTGYDTNSAVAKGDMDQVISWLYKNYSIISLRAKIEDIVFDSKTNVNRLK